MIDYKCTSCGAAMRSPGSMFGMLEKCPKCGEQVKVEPNIPSQSETRDRDIVWLLKDMRTLLTDVRREVRWISIWSKIFVFGVGGIIIIGILIMIVTGC